MLSDHETSRHDTGRHDTRSNLGAKPTGNHVSRPENSRPENSRWDKLRWLTARLRAMSLSEIQHRLKTRSIKKQWKRDGAPLATNLPTLPDLERIANLPFYAVGIERDALRAAAGESEIVALLKEADEALEGRWRFFAFADDQSIPIPPDPSATPLTGTFAGAQPIDWHRCDISGLRADPSAFGLDFDYKDFAAVGNVKYTWEKSRHHHTTIFALAYAITGEDHYARAAAYQIQSWLEQNPAPNGINWSSGIEVGVRLIAWTWVFHLLKGHPSWGKWFSKPELWQSIYQHQQYLASFESRGSSANNHLLAELAGLYIAASTWPVFPESQAWAQKAKSELEHEIPLQFFAEGLNKEMGFDYHVFALEIALHPALMAAKRNEPFSPNYLERLEKGIQAIALLRDAKGNHPRFGDSDEGLVAQLGPRRDHNSEGILEVGRRFFSLNYAAPHSGKLPATLLVGTNHAPSKAATSTASTASSFAFKDAGLYSLASSRGTPKEVLVLADAGPLGFLAIAAHGHADTLHFTLNVGGQPVLVDPGTFVYHTDPPWRQAFKSTSYHNTLELDGKDSSEYIAAFLWGQKANSTVHTWEPRNDGGLLIASHDGYTRLPGKPVHTRKFELRDQILEISDTVTGSGTESHTAKLHFHLHPDCKLEQEAPNLWLIRYPTGSARVEFDPRLAISAIKGDERGRRGWYSPRFDAKVKTYVLEASIESSLPLELKTRFEVL
jgi:Heparinase II/III-like protein/Heparinase II/III N-terminus